MNHFPAQLVDAEPVMTPYDQQVWEKLNDHWERRDNRRSLPNWASGALDRTGELAGKATRRMADIVPDQVIDPFRRAGDAVAYKAAGPAVSAAASLLDLVNDWAQELNDPSTVEKLARKRGLAVETFTDLQNQELKACDRLLTRNSLSWRTAGAVEGGAMGMLAMVPVAGIPMALTADILVIQVLSASIAARVAYSYGYDAKDPAEQLFIQRLVRRSFIAQAAKAKPLNDTARALHAVKGRVRWSDKLRQDHRLLAAVEKLMQAGPAGAKVPVQHVAKVTPYIGVIIGAGVNSMVLGGVAVDAQRYCQTRFLCEKYGLPLPAALADFNDDEEGPEAS
ncbi:EcsC family protein [Arthrobacter caoxuetaonis]|uniref:EcsC family protein n=1 Tax=Arthrobacter caoxuetaonis TaxID=2886935 RepID=UPI001D13F38B|nr:EcsC family protein [Arthrobacter caoxuetaonis]MCC3282919.1 EcsC family protein [Arthrobacter caoxuetaonis]